MPQPTAPVGDSPPPAGSPFAGPPSPPAPAPVPAPAPHRDTVAIDQPPAADAPAAPPSPPPAPPTVDREDTGGLGGLFAHSDPVDPPPAAPDRARTAAFAQPQVPVPAPVPAPSDDDEDEDDAEPQRRTGLLIALGLLLVVVLAVGGWLVLRDPDGGRTGATGTPSEVTDGGGAEPGPQPGDVQEVEGVPFTLQAVQVDDTCVGHSYGETATFFGTTNCTGLSRALYSTQLDGDAVVVSVARVRMPDTATARDLRALTDRNGSGNVNDLLREGVTWAGGPTQLSSAEYASAVSGPTVTIVESSWIAPETAAGGTADVDRIAALGLSLTVPPFPDE
jgi:hypothetical protein